VRLKRKKRKEDESRERKARRGKKRPDLTFKVQVRVKISHTVKSLSGSVDLHVLQCVQVLLFMHLFVCCWKMVRYKGSKQERTITNTTFIINMCCLFVFADG
jgi:hypothetical protein